jgi:homopolymeric O-antigen transport system permease protein
MTELSINVYTPASPLRDPRRFVHDMWQDLVASRELAWRLFIRDLSARYRQSVLGYVWVFIPPLVASLPFVYLNSQGVMKVGSTDIPYAAYAVIGTTIWQAFVDAVNAPLNTVLAARSMLIRINLPREAVLLSALAQVGLGFLARLALVIGVFLWFGLALPPTAALFPFGILSIVLAGFMIGVLLTPIGMLYSDIQQTLPIFTTFLMLLTPVVYPLPESGVAGSVATFNPLTPLIMTTRDWLTLGTTTHAAGFFIVTAITVVLLLFGWITFRVAMPHLIARIGN